MFNLASSSGAERAKLLDLLIRLGRTGRESDGRMEANAIESGDRECTRTYTDLRGATWVCGCVEGIGLNGTEGLRSNAYGK